MNYIIQILFCCLAIGSAFIIWKKDSKEVKKGQRVRLRILFVLAIGGSLLALAYGIKNEKEQEKNSALLQRIDTLQNDVLNQITGGKSLVKMFLYNGNYVGFQLLGKYPLQNVHVRLVDLNSPDPLKRKEYEFNIRFLQKDMWVTSNQTIEMDTLKGININIFYEANNGSSSQLVRLRYVKGSWKTAERIFRGFYSENNCEEFIDPDYPIKSINDIFVLNK